MVGFFSRLEARARQVDSLLCIGLDPHPDDLSAPRAQDALDFCLCLIEACAEQAAAFKPNAAFFEAFGAPGIEILAQVIAAVPEEIPVILDAKRGDIASTAQAYARAAFHTLRADAITASPYLGGDSLEPFLSDPEYGVFLLCKTSNPGAADLQDLRLAEGGEALFERVAHLAQAWNVNDNLGLVVGATHPGALARVRALAPGMWILAPGVGAQGGDLAAALHAGLRQDGLGLLVPVSRAVSRADHPGLAAEKLRLAINSHRAPMGITGLPTPGESQAQPAHATQSSSLNLKSSISNSLLEAGCVRFGQFTLKSGLISPIYLDLRRLVGYPSVLEQAAEAYAAILRKLDFDRLAALPYAALPIGAAISLHGGWPLIYPRKETKDYGTRAEVEGVYQKGERVVVIDDLATTGGSKFEAIDRLKAVGLKVKDVVVLIDRQSGAAEALAQQGYRLHCVFTLTELLDSWQAQGRITPQQAQETRDFMCSTQS